MTGISLRAFKRSIVDINSVRSYDYTYETYFVQLWYKFIYLLSILLIDLLDMHLSGIDNDPIIFKYVHFWWRTNVRWFWYTIINETIFHILVKLRVNQLSSDIFVEVFTCWNNSIENERSFDFIITLYDNWNFLLDSVWLLWIYFFQVFYLFFLTLTSFVLLVDYFPLNNNGGLRNGYPDIKIPITEIFVHILLWSLIVEEGREVRYLRKKIPFILNSFFSPIVPTSLGWRMRQVYSSCRDYMEIFFWRSVEYCWLLCNHILSWWFQYSILCQRTSIHHFEVSSIKNCSQIEKKSLLEFWCVWCYFFGIFVYFMCLLLTNDSGRNCLWFSIR
jgi:hypothetical protein